MEKSSKHYKKILKRWKQFESILKITSIVIVGGTAVTSIVLGFGAFAIPMVFGILAAVGATEGIISETLVMGLVKKKVSKFKKKIDHIQEYISKSWFLFEKIRDDNIVTLAELDEFKQLMINYENGLAVAIDTEEDDFLKLRETLKHQAEKEAKKEATMDLKKKMV